MIHIVRDIKRWECKYKDCGARCCESGIQLTLSDIENISALGYSREDFAYFDEGAQMFRLKDKNGKCIFLDKKFKCSIRENEPIVCRLLPFKIVDVKYSDTPIMRLEPVVDCPGVGCGPELSENNKYRIERDALRFLQENQKLQKELKQKKMKKYFVE